MVLPWLAVDQTLRGVEHARRARFILLILMGEARLQRRMKSTLLG